MLTLQGCTSSHTLSPLTAVYTTCTRQPSSGSPMWVSATACLNTQVSSPGLSPIQVPSAGSPAEVSHTAPNDVNRVPEIPNGYSVHPATYLPHHSPPLRSALSTASSSYKHQKLLATPGQRTRVNKKSSGVIFQGPMHGSSCILNHIYRSQCLRSASMKQPTMYSYMASHRYLYQIVFTTPLSLPT